MYPNVRSWTAGIKFKAIEDARFRLDELPLHR